MIVSGSEMIVSGSETTSSGGESTSSGGEMGSSGVETVSSISLVPAPPPQPECRPAATSSAMPKLGRRARNPTTRARPKQNLGPGSQRSCGCIMEGEVAEFALGTWNSSSREIRPARTGSTVGQKQHSLRAPKMPVARVIWRAGFHWRSLLSAEWNHRGRRLPVPIGNSAGKGGSLSVVFLGMT